MTLSQVSLVVLLLISHSVLIFRVKRDFSKMLFRDLFVRLLACEGLSVYLWFKITTYFSAYQKAPQYFTVLSWINFLLVMISFALFLWSYLLREPAKVYAARLKDVLLPALCAVLPLMIFELGNEATIHFLLKKIYWPKVFKLYWGAELWTWDSLSIWFILVGNALAVSGLFALRSSFSVFAEVRSVVTNGIYRFVRHPIYVGQSLATLGFCIQSPSFIKIILTVIFIGGQMIRARYEEILLSTHQESYRSYTKQTGFYLPKTERFKL